MSTATHTTHVISLGGSLLFSGDTIDTAFLKSFTDLVRRRVEAGDEFIIVTGGGKVSRIYQQALETLGSSSDDRDWMGIYTCRYNAQLVRLLLQDHAHPDIILKPEDLDGVTAPIAFAGGIAPGYSSDNVAMQLAVRAQAKTVINMSNITHVFDKDPAKFPDAKAFDDLTWDGYAELIPAEWTPGLHSPFDPRAAATAREHGIDVYIISKDTDNLDQLLNAAPFVGTKLHA